MLGLNQIFVPVAVFAAAIAGLAHTADTPTLATTNAPSVVELPETNHHLAKKHVSIGGPLKATGDSWNVDLVGR